MRKLNVTDGWTELNVTDGRTGGVAIIKDQFFQCEKGTFFDGGGGGGGFYDQNGPILLSGCILRPHHRTDICVTREK